MDSGEREAVCIHVNCWVRDSDFCSALGGLSTVFLFVRRRSVPLCSVFCRCRSVPFCLFGSCPALSCFQDHLLFLFSCPSRRMP